MADTTRRANSRLAVISSHRVAMRLNGRKRASPVDGPFAETKEWMGCGTQSSRELRNSARRPPS